MKIKIQGHLTTLNFVPEDSHKINNKNDNLNKIIIAKKIKMTDQIDMIYLKICLYFGLFQNHLRKTKFIYNKTIIKLTEKAIVRNVQFKN